MIERMEEEDMCVKGTLFEMRDDLIDLIYVCYSVGSWHNESTVKKEEEE